MYFRVLATDYDGTLARHGAVDEATLGALHRAKEAGLQLILVTGREMAELRQVMPEFLLFDRIVAENGGVLYEPGTGRERTLAVGPPRALVQKLLERGVDQLSVGRTIIATWRPNEAVVLSAISELGLDHQITFNKSAVMVLPAGTNKSTGLKAAAGELGVSLANVTGVGDAENDLNFLGVCGCSAAVANALPSVKVACDFVLASDHGAGVAELIEAMLRNDAALVPPRRRGILIGTDMNGTPAWLTPQESLLIVGGSGSGKSRFATLLIERMVDRGFGTLVLDPEGEYEQLEDVVAIGDGTRAASLAEALRLLRRGTNVVIGATGINPDARCELFNDLAPQLLRLKEDYGRPHWVVVDEAHHYLPLSCDSVDNRPASASKGLVLVTINPDWLPHAVVNGVDYVMALGSSAGRVLAEYTKTTGAFVPEVSKLGADEVLLWARSSPDVLRVLRIDAPRQRHERHKGKYARGDVGESRSFYFRWSPDGGVRRARNLAEFITEADECPDEVWERHLRSGDFTAWFLDIIRDEELGRVARNICNDRTLSAGQSRQYISIEIRKRYEIPEI